MAKKLSFDFLKGLVMVHSIFYPWVTSWNGLHVWWMRNAATPALWFAPTSVSHEIGPGPGHTSSGHENWFCGTMNTRRYRSNTSKVGKIILNYIPKLERKPEAKRGVWKVIQYIQYIQYID